MKRPQRAIAILSLSFLSIVPTAGCDDNDSDCVAASGSVIVEERPVASFSGIELRSAMDIRVKRGDQTPVALRSNENVLPVIRTEVDNSTLVVDQERCTRDVNTLELEATVPNLDHLRLSGSGTMQTDERFTTAAADIDISGSGIILYDALCTEVDVDLSGSGSLTLRGGSESLRVVVSGSGNVRALEAPTSSATIRISGSGTCRVAASEHLVIRITGSGTVFYSGDPVSIDSSVTGSGRIVRLQ